MLQSSLTGLLFNPYLEPLRFQFRRAYARHVRLLPIDLREERWIETADGQTWNEWATALEELAR